MNNKLSTLLCVLALFVAPCAWAQDKIGDGTDMQALKSAVAADKKGLVASTLDLTPAEAKKFWPLYDAYQRSLDATNRRRSAALEGVIGMNKPMTNLYARNLSNELTAADEAEIKARRTMQNRLLKALPAKKAARYLQLEAKIQAVQAYDIAAAIPLIR
ncbi:MAG: hypothetical protein ACM3PU_16875 [Gemmatimonadota bacterium]